MLKMFYLYGFVRWTNYIWWAIDNNYTCSFISFLSLQLNEFLQPEAKQNLSSFQKITCITAIAEGYCAADVSLLFKWIVSSALSIFPWNPWSKRKKASQQFLCKLSSSLNLRKSRNDAFRRGWGRGSHFLCVTMRYCVRKSICNSPLNYQNGQEMDNKTALFQSAFFDGDINGLDLLATLRINFKQIANR